MNRQALNEKGGIEIKNLRTRPGIFQRRNLILFLFLVYCSYLEMWRQTTKYLSIVHNVRSLPNKVDIIYNELSEYDVIGITEGTLTTLNAIMKCYFMVFILQKGKNEISLGVGHCLHFFVITLCIKR